MRTGVTLQTVNSPINLIGSYPSQHYDQPKGLVDEGEDTNMYTYAKFGAQILNEPGSKAYQSLIRKRFNI